MDTTATETRERILSAAETLFATKGFEKTSTREITMAAGVNIALLHYYFGSKGALAEELFVRLVARATETRLAELSSYLKAAQAAGEPVRIGPLVDCFVRPYVDPGQAGKLFAQLVLQHRLAPSEMTHRVFEQYLDPFARQFVDALCLVDRAVPRAEWFWRYTFMIGTVVLAVTGTGPGNRLATLTEGEEDETRGDDLARHLKEFLCTALSGPPQGGGAAAYPSSLGTGSK